MIVVHGGADGCDILTRGIWSGWGVVKKRLTETHGLSFWS